MKLYIRQKVFSWRDRFTVKDEYGHDCYFAEGEFFSMGKQLHVYDANGHAVAHIRQKLFSFMPRFVIEVMGLPPVEIAQEFSFFKHNFRLAGVPWYLHGDFIGHEYELTDNHNTLMTLSKQWFTWGDSYEMNIAPDQNEQLCLCIALAVDCALCVRSSN